jgi:hypothetical protein
MRKRKRIDELCRRRRANGLNLLTTIGYGLVDTEETRQTSTNRLLSRTTSQYHQDTRTAAGTVFRHLDQTVAYRHDLLDGRPLATTTKTSQCDAYGTW